MDYRSKYKGQEIDERLGRTELIRPYTSLSSVGPYIYRIKYDFIEYDYAKDYLLSKNPHIEPFGCTSVRNGRWYGRQLDWYYDNSVDFFITTYANDGRHKVDGVASVTELTKSLVDSGEYSELYRLLPFYLLDGKNDANVFCNTNVVPVDYEPTTETVPLVEKRDQICTLMVPRYILDHFDSALEAIEYIRDYVSIYAPRSLQMTGYEAHFMVGDAEHTYVLEIVNNVIVYNEIPYMTNFYIDGVTFTEDGKVYTPADALDGHFASSQGITPYGCGLERFNLVVDAYDSIETKEDMRALLNNLMYTNAYKVMEHPWYTEFVGIHPELTVDAVPSTYEQTMANARGVFLSRDRNTPVDEPRTWHTTHSSLYDLQTGKVYIVSQEDTENEYVFNTKETYTAEEVDAIVASLEERISNLENNA